MKRLLALFGLLAFALSTAPAAAAVVIVKAKDNSVAGGTPLNTGLAFTAGDLIVITSDLNDLWSAGALPRFSDANGLIVTRFANGLDDSGQPLGTQIGAVFGNTTQLGFTAPFGSLVGRINGQFQLLGANFNGTAWNTGTLELFYWDSNSFDNFGEITFRINDVNGAVPEPSTWLMMIVGFGLIGGAMRAGRRPRLSLRQAHA